MANSAGVRFDALLSLMARLRGEGGCPWDRQQTRASLKPYLIEEAYEVLQAIDEDDTGHLAEELGDLLFQVVFHSQVAAEAGEFTMSDVLDRLIEKMTRRHPHVFGDQAVADAQDALRQWERIKRDEGGRAGEPRSALDGVPPSLPALLRAQRLQVKAGRVGFDWPTWRQAWDKVREEVAEMDEALDVADGERIRHELGDVLFSVVMAEFTGTNIKLATDGTLVTIPAASGQAGRNEITVLASKVDVSLYAFGIEGVRVTDTNVRLPVRIFDANFSLLDAEHTPRRVAQLKNIALQALDREVFVDRSNNEPAWFEHNRIISGVRNCAAGGDGSQPRATTTA